MSRFLTLSDRRQRQRSVVIFSSEYRMNGSVCPRVSFDFSGRFLPPVYILVFIVGLLANGWGLKSLPQKWKKLGNINVFVLNLGLADVLYLLTVPFLMVYHFMGSKWIFGHVFCKITRFCFNLNLYSSIGFLTCISVYRYLAIVHPMRVMGRITVLHSVGISVLVWLMVSIQILPDMFFSKTFGNKTVKCYETTSKIYVEDYLKYSLGWTLTGFCIPLLITLGCYGHVIVVLCRTNTTDKVLKQRSLKLLLILILLFSVCYIPYHVLKNLNLWSRVLLKQRNCRNWFDGVYIAHQISRGLVCLNSALNPLVYLHGDENIPAQLRRLLMCARETFSRLSLSNFCSVPVAQTADEVEQGSVSLH
ncbi:P2Y purinoceptor 1-like [Eleginops maclovinus]|uniref:P2Y purinoceptor 1-like n=1 Tax=Eleginops maclovinus TaxID=56733 RepID=UPI0030805E06